MNWQSIDKRKPPVEVPLLISYIAGSKRLDYCFAILKGNKIYYTGSYHELFEDLSTCHSEDIDAIEPDDDGNPILWCLFERSE